jgi:DNA topoisomerase-1
VTTWEVGHVSINGGTATIKYTGKSGVDHEKKITDKKVVSCLKDAIKDKKKGDLILSSKNDDAECTISASHVNEYLKPFEITAKDIRGLHANEEVRERLKEVRKKGPKELPKARKEKDKILKAEFLEALEGAAEAVGHEPATLRSQYLVPGMEDAYMHDGTILDKLNGG